MKRNHRGQWTTEAIEELERLASQGLSLAQIAHQVGRTEEATRLRARLLGVTLAKAQPRSEDDLARKRDENARSADDTIDAMVRQSIAEHGA